MNQREKQTALDTSQPQPAALVDVAGRVTESQMADPGLQGQSGVEPKPEPATEKQIAYLNRLGVQIVAGLTKREASRLIDQALTRTSDVGGTRVRREY